MNIKMMTDQAIEKCRVDAEEFARKVYGNPDNADWLESFVGSSPFVEKTYEIPDFELEIPVKGAPDEKEIVAKNCIVLHKALKNLPAYILVDIRFWAWITLTKGYKFAIYKSEISKNYISNNWFPKGENNRRSAMLQTLGMEFFIANWTENTIGSTVPYSMTPYLSNSRVLYHSMVYRNITDIPAVAQAIIKAWADIEALGDAANIKNRSDQFRASMKYVSTLGSVMLIDAIPAEELYGKIISYLRELVGIKAE